jgi:hypothetical protein
MFPLITSEILVFKIKATSEIRKKILPSSHASETDGSNLCKRDG